MGFTSPFRLELFYETDKRRSVVIWCGVVWCGVVCCALS